MGGVAAGARVEERLRKRWGWRDYDNCRRRKSAVCVCVCCAKGAKFIASGGSLDRYIYVVLFVAQAREQYNTLLL